MRTDNDIDIIGQETLEVIGAADKFNKWMYDTIAPHCSGRIMEIGSGIGNISKYFLKHGDQIMLTDLRSSYTEILKEEFSDASNLLGVENIDLVHPDFDNAYAKYLGTFDTLFALNVVEHIKDDKQALVNSNKLLRAKGKIIILVPAYQALYNQFDIALEHFRRYTKQSIAQVFEAAEIKILNQQYFNAVGILGWYVTGNILRKKQIPEGQMKLYNTFVPVIKLIDKIILKSFGLSVITVGQKL